jgi:hypothetical protein
VVLAVAAATCVRLTVLSQLFSVESLSRTVVVSVFMAQSRGEVRRRHFRISVII